MHSQQDKIAEWMRSLSERLQSSHHGSTSFQNRVTKGRSRELQVLDILEGLLPSGVNVGRDVVIVDSKGSEAPSFDGVIYDRMRFPVLYFEGNHREESIISILLESVLLCIETKSNLCKDELDDTIRKIKKLELLQSVSNSMRQPVLLLAYEADNMNLSFVDYCAAFASKPTHVPNIVCVLNKGLFTTAKKVNDEAILSPRNEHGSYPVFTECGKEALLLTYFLVVRLLTEFSTVCRILEAYVQEAFKDVSLFSFAPEFIDKISDQSFHDCIRRKFFDTANRPIAEVYKALNM